MFMQSMQIIHYITLYYKAEGCGFDSDNDIEFVFQFIQYFQPHYSHGVDSASNGNRYQKPLWG
jgi:hypothetical protein